MKAELQNISSSMLHSFVNHPFSVRDDEAMEKMKKSVRENGILNSVLVRPREKGGYEIISGHRRVKAGELLRLPGIPCLVCDMDDDHAIIAMADSNLAQRERLRTSERAFALRMKSEAARRIRLANPGTSEEARVSETVAKDSDMSARQVERYVKLTKLSRQLLDMLMAVGQIALGGMAVGSKLAMSGFAAGGVAIGDEARGAMTLPLDERGLTWDIAALTQALEERCPGLPEWVIRVVQNLL